MAKTTFGELTPQMKSMWERDAVRSAPKTDPTGLPTRAPVEDVPRTYSEEYLAGFKAGVELIIKSQGRK